MCAPVKLCLEVCYDQGYREEIDRIARPRQPALRAHQKKTNKYDLTCQIMNLPWEEKCPLAIG